MFQGSCHCGAVHFEADGDMPTEGMSCNCSICRRKGTILSFVPAAQVRVAAEPDAMTIYTFKSHKIRHKFCATCGVTPFAEAAAPDGTPMMAINLNCVDGIDLAGLKVSQYDGAAV